MLSCNTDDSVVIQRLAEESGFLCLLSEAVGERQNQATGVDINFQKINQHHLWNAEKQDRVCEAKGVGRLEVKVIFVVKTEKT